MSDSDASPPPSHAPLPPAPRPPPPPKPSPLSLHDPTLPHLLLLDNYDSFTYNLYQYLAQLGARVLVLRNDDLTPSDFPSLNVSHLVISPGPGHPRTDSGISRDAIRYYGGKVPILGVCMGLQCLVDAFGGTISYAGEIVHGKASPIRHDGHGIFRNVPQNVLATRYHSLAAGLDTFPDELAVTATTADSGVVMGARHRVWTVEAVQYHPESILSHDGHAILKNFLSLSGGTWAQNPQAGVPPANPSSTGGPSPPAFDPSPASAAQAALPSILLKIQQQRLLDIEASKSTPGHTPSDLATQLALHLAPPLTPVLPRIKSVSTPSHPAIMAEIKRASPSKGAIAPNASAPQQALSYALAGAAVISVLTEPKWFLGSLEDMRLARQAISHLPNRPAILRKDFILDPYQILEARLAGADLVLLIVAMLTPAQLSSLYAYSLSLGMEPLVEVNNADEMARALELGAKLVGVNNRNLHDFKVDMGTTSRLEEMVKGKDVVLCALSGISSRKDVEAYQGVGAVLVGEALMRAPSPSAFMRSLLGLPASPPPPENPFPAPMVKVCGIRTPEEALVCAGAGADMLGLNFVPASKRSIDIATAAVIARTVMPLRMSPSPHPLGEEPDAPPKDEPGAMPWYTHSTTHLASLPRPLLVGLFQDSTLQHILHVLSRVPLDMVQLHGSEPAEWAKFIPVPVIKAYHVGAAGAPLPDPIEGFECVALLDTAMPKGQPGGGLGKSFDWDVAAELVSKGERETGHAMPLILAGGLTPENVRAAVRRVRPWGVDVASGVEVGGRKEEGKVRAFVRGARGAWDPEEEVPNGAEGEEPPVNVEQEVIGSTPAVPTPKSPTLVTNPSTGSIPKTPTVQDTPRTPTSPTVVVSAPKEDGDGESPPPVPPKARGRPSS